MRYDASLVSLFNPHKSGLRFDAAQCAGQSDALEAELSRLAYLRFEDDPSALAEALARLGLSPPTCFHDARTSTQAFATLAADGTALVAFRGTEAGLADLWTDARFLPRAWDRGGKVHRGFAHAYARQVRGAIGAWLGACGAARMVFTGHSLGAALASLLASDWPTAELVTFGSPRVGNAAFAALFAGRDVRRYRQCCDLVTRIPFALGYAHFGALRYVNRLGAIMRADSAAMAADCRAARAEYPRYRREKGSVPWRALADHTPLNYVTALLGIREN